MASSPPHRRDWLALPPELTTVIISRLSTVEILRSAQFVCKSWYEVCKDPLVWREINFFDTSRSDPLFPAVDINGLDRLCRCAVDRSSGQLVDIEISYFGSDDLISYIVDRCTLIKTFRLSYCTFVSNKCLIEATARLPLLEELDLTLCLFDSESLESVGRSCPRLKSLKLSSPFWRLSSIIPEEDNDAEAMAIAKTMPELRSLMIVGNPMTFSGLEAILGGCPRLELLDLRLCKFIFFGAMSAESGFTLQKIKCLRFPMDSTADMNWDVNCGFRWDFWHNIGYEVNYEHKLDYGYDYDISYLPDDGNFVFMP